MLSDVLSQKVETCLERRNPGLFRRKLQTTFTQTTFQQRFDFLLQDFPGVTRDDEVIRVTHEMHLVPNPAGVTVFRKVFPQQRLHAVQNQVGNRGRDDPSLWNSYGRREHP